MEDSLSLLEKNADWSLSIFDHAAVFAIFSQKIVHNMGTIGGIISRLDPRLLADTEGRTIMEAANIELLVQTSEDWDPYVTLQFTKMRIRTAAATAAGKIKARFRDEELVLNEDINNIVNDLADANTPSFMKTLLIHKLADLRHLKRLLVNKIGTRLEQRTARKWYNEGELSDKYFFNILNKVSNNELKTVVKDDRTELTDDLEVEAEFRELF